MAKETPGKMYALATVLTVLALAAIILRLVARKVKKGKLCWDDYLIFFAFVFSFATAICMYIGASLGDLGRHTKVKQGKHHLVPVFTQRTEIFLQVEYATFITTTLALGLTKVSVLMFYKRIFRGTIFDIAVWTSVAVVVVWTVAFFFSNVFQCWPIETNWAGWGNAVGKCIHVNKMFIVQAYTDVFTDVLILSLPVPNIWTLQIPRRHKVGISLIFLLGALTVCTGVAKLIVFYNVVAAASDTSTTDVTYISTPIIYWGMVESSLGIVGACLPLMRPLVAGDSQSTFLRSLRSIVFPSTRNSGSGGVQNAHDDQHYACSKERAEANQQRMESLEDSKFWTKFGSEDRTLVGDTQAPSPVIIKREAGLYPPTIEDGSNRSEGWERPHNQEPESDIEEAFTLEVRGIPVTPIGDVEKQVHSLRAQ